MDKLISELISYGLKYHLVHIDDKIYVINRLLELFEKSEFQWMDTDARQLDAILSDMNDYAIEHGLIEEDTIIKMLLLASSNGRCLSFVCKVKMQTILQRHPMKY